MRTTDTPLVCPDRIESTLRRIETECNLFIAAAMKRWETEPSMAMPNLVLVRERVADVARLLNGAKGAEAELKRFDYGGLAMDVALYGIPAVTVAAALWSDGRSGHAITAVVGGALVLMVDRVVVPFMKAWPFTESTRKRRRTHCIAELHKIRCMLHVIDSHVLAKSMRGHWDTKQSTQEVALPGKAGIDTDWIYQDPSIAIRYLSIATSLARCCAKIAALYPQWFTDSEVSREADSLAAVAFEIERGCLAKTELVRQGALRLGQPGQTDFSVCVGFRMADAA